MKIRCYFFTLFILYAVILITPLLSYGESRQYLYKELYFGMQKQDASILLNNKSPKIGDDKITYFDEKFAGHSYFVHLTFNKDKLEQVSLIINEKEHTKIRYIVYDFINEMLENRFITCFFVDGEKLSISLDNNIIRKGINNNFLRFMAFETETVESLSIEKEKTGDIQKILDKYYEVLKKYPKNKRIVDFIFSEGMVFVTFKLFKDQSEFVDNIFKSRNAKEF